MKKLFWIDLEKTSVLHQLQIEEALLRTDERNWIVVNRGSPRAIVMGLSGLPAQLLDLPRVHQDQIEVIRRLSGGGTVIVDEKTLFISFIFAKKDIPISPFPESIMRWSYQLYHDAWNIPGFSLRDNDYAVHDRKCGGNAQYICKDRWLHHTTFLWDYSDANMDYLLLPEKQPSYRKNRSHKDFLCRLKDVAPSSTELLRQLNDELVKRFDIVPLEAPRVPELLQRSHRKTTEKWLWEN